MKKRRKSAKVLSAKDVKLTQDVKRANQRLRELEKHGMENSPAYKAVERLMLAENPAVTTTGKGQIKFTTSVKKLSPAQRQHLREQVKKFLEAETSTTKGVKNVAERAQKAYKEHGGLPEDLDIKDSLSLWSTGIVNSYKAAYGSDATEIIINKLMLSDMTNEEAIKFLLDHYGQPLSDIIEAFPREEMEQGDEEPWEWGDIFEV